MSEPTIETWGHVLAASYILYFLPLYHRNYGKRLIKMPKLYFIDAALAAWLTRQPFEPLDKFRALAGDEAAESGVLVCRVEQPQPLPQGNLALPWQRFPAWLREQLTARTERLYKNQPTNSTLSDLSQ